MNARLYWTLVLAGVTLFAAWQLALMVGDGCRKIRGCWRAYRVRRRGNMTWPYSRPPWSRRQALRAFVKDLAR